MSEESGLNINLSASEGHISNVDGTTLFCRYWNNDPASEKTDRFRGLVFICHGYGEHCLWYNEVAEMLVQSGFFVFGHDHVGHGQSEGARGDVTDFKVYTTDVFSHIEAVKSQMDPSLPVFIIGHSMGGAITILASIERPQYFSGAVLIGPAVIPNPDAAGPIKICMGKLLARIFPQLVMLKLDSTLVSRDPEVVKRYNEDPLVIHFGMKCRWGVSLLRALQQIEKNCASVECPLLILHGDQDQYCELSGSQKLFQEASSKDKEIKVYKDCYHQLHNELQEDKVKVLKDISDWLQKRVESPKEESMALNVSEIKTMVDE